MIANMTENVDKKRTIIPFGFVIYAAVTCMIGEWLYDAIINKNSIADVTNASAGGFVAKWIIIFGYIFISHYVSPQYTDGIIAFIKWLSKIMTPVTKDKEPKVKEIDPQEQIKLLQEQIQKMQNHQEPKYFYPGYQPPTQL